MGKRTPINAEVIIYDQEQIERMIKKFIKKVKKSGILEEVRAKEHHVKKSVKNRKKKIERKRLAQQATKKYKEKFKD